MMRLAVGGWRLAAGTGRKLMRSSVTLEFQVSSIDF